MLHGDVSESHLTDNISHHCVLLVVLPLLTVRHKHVYVQYSCQRHDADTMLDGVMRGQRGEEIKKRKKEKNKTSSCFCRRQTSFMSFVICHFILKTETIKMMEENHAACG